MGSTPIDGAMCVPNFTGAGRRRRRNFAVVTLVIGIALFAAVTFFDVDPWLRALVGLPFAASIASYLQVTRNTCVAHARAGTIEHDDFSTTSAPSDQLAASRKVAATILRDASLAGAVIAAVAVASGLLLG